MPRLRRAGRIAVGNVDACESHLRACTQFGQLHYYIVGNGVYPRLQSAESEPIG